MYSVVVPPLIKVSTMEVRMPRGCCCAFFAVASR
jgi:hypothetical protein